MAKVRLKTTGKRQARKRGLGKRVKGEGLYISRKRKANKLIST